MKSCLVQISCILTAALMLAGCTNSLIENNEASIEGIISDMTTLEPVPAVNVVLEETGASMVTGTDGAFSFHHLKEGSYNLRISKEGYKESKHTVLAAATDKVIKSHLSIERMPAVMTLSPTELDFGDNYSNNTLSFSMVNRNYASLSWEILYNCPWIEEVTPQKSISDLGYGKTQTIVVIINREKLIAGNNETVIVVRTSNGSSDLSVRATGQEKRLPALNIKTTTDIKATSAILNATITDNGIPEYTERGFVVGDSNMPTQNTGLVTIPAAVDKNKDFSARVNNLSLNTTYYARAYAKNKTGIAYSTNQEIITTTNGLPVISKTEIQNIGAKYADCVTTISSNGASAIEQCGVCWSNTSMTPSINNSHTTQTTNQGQFSSQLTDLNVSTLYYCRAFAKNSYGIAYGPIVQFTTTDGGAVAILGNISGITATKAISGIKVTNTGGAILKSCGICWSTSQNPTIQMNKSTAVGIQLNTDYSCDITNLSPNTTYYVRAFASTDIKTTYSEQSYFTTTSGKPTTTTSTQYSRGLNYLVISGSSETEIGVPIIRQGICWSSNDNPTISDGIVVSNTTTSPFSCRIEGLQPRSTYYCRAFAENAFGLSYGESYGFQTATPPTTLSGHVYDQDGYPLPDVVVSRYDGYPREGKTDKNGYYSIELSSGVLYGNCEFQASLSEYDSQIKTVNIKGGQDNQLDFNLTIKTPFKVDFGTGTWIKPGDSWAMIFSCNQTSLAGKTTSKVLRIKNYRSVPVSYSLTNYPSSGVALSSKNGTISANDEAAITVTFAYPSTSSQMVQLVGCSSGSKTYLWNWEFVISGYYWNGYSMVESSCAACCSHTTYITVDNYSEGFDMVFNQYAVWR